MASAGRGRGNALRAVLEKRMKDQKKAGDVVSQLEDEMSKVKVEPGPDVPEETPQVELQEVKITEPVLFKGSSGKDIKMAVNFLLVKFEEDGGIFNNRIDFLPPVDEKEQRYKIFCEARKSFKLPDQMVFQGSRVLSPKPLVSEDGGPLRFTSTEFPNHEVVFTYLDRLSSANSEFIHCLNNIFGRVLRRLGMSRLPLAGANRNITSYFSPSLKTTLPKHKLQIWPGYSVAVDEYEGGLRVQCDLTTKILREEGVRNIVTACLKRDTGKSSRESAKKELIGTRVITMYNSKIYQIEDIDFDKNPTQKFNQLDGSAMTLMEYYSRKYGIDIKDKEQPLIVSSIKPRPGNPKQEPQMVWLIPELCLPVGMTELQRQNFVLMKDVRQVTSQTPVQRQESLLKLAKQLTETEDAVTLLRGWGLKVSKKIEEVQGRILKAPSLTFADGKEPVGPKGDWARAATSRRALQTVKLNNWTLVATSKDVKLAKTFLDMLKKVSPKIGFQFDVPKIVEIANDRIDSYLKVVKHLPPETQLVMTIFPGAQKADRYAAVKKVCYIDKGLPSQVVMQKTLSNEKRLQSVVQKLALQITCKLGGELWGLDIPVKNMCVIGMDVYRDKSSGNNTLTGIVANVNNRFSKYFSQVVISRDPATLVGELAKGIEKTLEKYHDLNGVYPERVVIYRDGMPGGHFTSGLPTEAKAFEECVKKLQSSTSLTYVLVQKRQNTKMLEISHGKAENPPAGTVLDHTVTLRNFKDFYLVPMNVMLGTVTPIHYIVLSDNDDAMTPDIVQKISFALTHMYFNWPGNVKVPAPCQYAHKLVELIGEHLHKDVHPDLLDTLYYL